MLQFQQYILSCVWLSILLQSIFVIVIESKVVDDYDLISADIKLQDIHPFPRLGFG